jgi:UDP-glucose 4-epimerase
MNPGARVGTVNSEVCLNENMASSSSVYGEPEEIPVDEDAPLRPVSVYGASKAACENLIHAYSKLYGIRAVALRYANVVGPRLRHGVIWDFINKLLKNPSELEILGDGKQTRSYVYIDDAVEATITAWRRTESSYEVYNIASDDWITVDEVAEEVIKAMNLNNVKKNYKPVLHGIGWPGDVKRIALKIDKIKKLGFKPAMNSREAVRATTRRLLLEEIQSY